jgi:energy-coupling factor transport system permease protein
MKFALTVTVFFMFFSIFSIDQIVGLMSSKLPYISITLSLCFRTIAILGDKTHKIKDVIKTRKVQQKNGGFLSKFKEYKLLAKSLIISATEDSLKTAETLESKCFTGYKRTNINENNINNSSILLLIDNLLMIVFITYGAIRGLFSFNILPQLQKYLISIEQLFIYVLLLICVLIPIFLEKGGHREDI